MLLRDGLDGLIRQLGGSRTSKASRRKQTLAQTANHGVSIHHPQGDLEGNESVKASGSPLSSSRLR